MSSSDLLEVPAVGADATANVNQTSPASAATQDRQLRAPANRESLVETVISHNDLQENNNTLNDSPSSTHQRTRTNDKDGGEDVELDDLKPSNASQSPKDMLNATLLPHIDVEDNYMTSLPPPPPFDLEIEDLTIGVPTSSGGFPILGKFFSKPAEDADGQPKSIVRNVSATCASGEMLAIIGGSGSGKTTVLNAIVGRLANLPIESGEISFMPSHRGISVSERKTLSARKMKDKIGFVKQQDTLLEHLTVRETLWYAAALRLPKEISAQTRELIVTQTIEELGLRDVADTIVGGALRKGISGGERRRLSIGCALVAMPSVLVADESTTGLDSFTAYALLLTLSQLARRNRTVILTLHQPRSATFPLFDRLLLLSKGRVVFSGPREKVLPWFQHVNEDFKPGDGVNPMDWLIDVSTVDTREGREEESRERVGLLVRRWEEEGPAFVRPREDEEDGERGSEEDEGDEGTLAVLSPPRRDRTSRTPLNASALEVASILSQTNWDMKRIGILKQTAVLLSRATKDVSRNYGLMLAFTLQSIILGAILGFAFFRLPEDPSGIQSLKTLSLQHLPYFTYLTLIYSVYRYCNTDLILFDREREDHLYAVFPWLISEFATNVPVLGISATLFALIIYFMVGMRTGDHFAWAIGIFIAENVLVQLVTVGFALISSSLNRVYATASTIVNSFQIFMIMTAGLFLLRPPVYINWMRFISPYYYGFRSVVISQFRDRSFSCDGIEGLARNQCDGNQVLNGVLVSPNINPGYYIAALCGMVVGTYSLAGIILHVYRPGGVKHANQLFSSGSGKEAMVSADMEIARQRIDVDVRHICLKWSRRGVEKTILHNINAKFPAGEVTAIMGPSGAGKSSLLQLVAGRQMNAGPMARFQVEGAVLFNGRPRFRGFRALVAFVEQEDNHHLPALTVRETLRYAAILRLPKTMSRKRKIARAEEVLQMLGLTDCADNVVGGELLKGISGGEKRRLSLAVEMISDPAVLVVDEPTSGLDALTAHNVMLALKAIAASGRTVIASIHQPRSDIWHAGIDNIVLLAKGGRTAFSCPKSEIGPLCASLGYPLPPMVNPADWILDLVSVDVRGDREQVTRKRVSLMIDNWAEREARKVEDKAANRDSVQGPEGVVNYDGKASVIVALPVVLERMARNLWRQPPVFWMRLYQTPLLACIMLMIYQRLKYGPTGGQDRMGFVLEIISPLAFVGVLNNVAVFPADRDIFFHEVRTSGAYSASTFVLAFTIVELPLEIAGALLAAVVTNIGAGMQTNPRIFFQFAFAEWALVSTGESIGMMFGSFTRSMGFNVSLVSTFITILVQLSGVVSVSLPQWLGTLAWSTTLKLSTRIVMVNEAVGLRLHCTDEEVMGGQCLVQTGEQLLELLGWKDWNVSKYCGILFAITVAYRLLAWAVIRAKIASL
ncbi:hypothetical protein FRC04_006173 [Tulasnella sp. 424]|nr:hypothetical protein FRC04_006173 [Tulasnella sp. 424]